MIRIVVLTVFCICLASGSANGQGVNIVANIMDAAGEGFNDPTLGAARTNALNFALGIWGNSFQQNYAGETVTIDVQFNPLGGTSSEATLGFAGSNGGGFLTGEPLGSNVFRNAPVLNHLAGSDVFAGSEMNGTFNSDVDGSTVLGSTTFYYGTDGNAPAGTVDFVEVAVHELGHGLGFGGTLRPIVAGGAFASQADLNAGLGVGASYVNGNFYNSYDHFMVRKSDGAALSGLSDADRFNAVINDNIAWSGAAGVAANGGSLIDMEGTFPFAFGSIPAGTWVLGSTYSHTDESDFPLDLMSPLSTTGTGFNPSLIDLGIMQDVGWTLSVVPEPGTFVFLMFTSLIIALRRRPRLAIC